MDGDLRSATRQDDEEFEALVARARAGEVPAARVAIGAACLDAWGCLGLPTRPWTQIAREAPLGVIPLAALSLLETVEELSGGTVVSRTVRAAVALRCEQPECEEPERPIEARLTTLRPPYLAGPLWSCAYPRPSFFSGAEDTARRSLETLFRACTRLLREGGLAEDLDLIEDTRRRFREALMA